MSVEGQIKRVFGKDYKMALAVSQAENGTRKCDRVSKPNTNGSVDIGVFQVNTVHLKRVTEAELKTCLGNIRYAHSLFKKQGHWGAWAAFNNGSYKRFLTE